MSSDDYCLIRKRGQWFYLSVEMGDVPPKETDPALGVSAYGSLEDAVRAANKVPTEYGLTIDLGDAR